MAATALHTDLYQLTMIAGYVAAGRQGQAATFELFVRRLPPNRGYLIAAGLGPALDFVQDLRFTPEQIGWLRTVPALRRATPGFFDYLSTFRFSGEVWAMPEGTPFFVNEPILRVTAPLAQAQLLETALLAIVNFETSVATKASRIVTAAQGRPVLEFGARRAHGPEAAVRAARAAIVGGCEATSLVEAGRRFGIPLSGTMAHSWVLAFDTELEAFTRYQELFQEHTVLLLDTFDTLEAARLIVRSGLRPPAVRLDSGDFVDLSRGVRRIFDAAGLTGTRILASGDLDEDKIAQLVAERAPIDGFGVGTALATSEDAPALGGVYKLVQIDAGGRARDVMKRSPGKATWPGRKQVWRIIDHGIATHDVVGLAGEDPPANGVPLLEQVMSDGRRTSPEETLAVTRARTRALVAQLPPGVRNLHGATPFEVRTTERLRTMLSDT